MTCYRCVLHSKATTLTSEISKTVYIKTGSRLHDIPYQSPFYTLYCQEASGEDRDVNACGNAHPEDKVKAEADPLLCFPCLETNRGVQGKVMSCFQVWARRVCHNLLRHTSSLIPHKVFNSENVESSLEVILVIFACFLTFCHRKICIILVFINVCLN